MSRVLCLLGLLLAGCTEAAMQTENKKRALEDCISYHETEDGVAKNCDHLK